MQSITDLEKIGTLTFDEALAQVAGIAHAKMPATMHARLAMGIALVHDKKVWAEDDGHSFSVQSSQDATKWWAVNGTCVCPDAQYRAPEAWCKHRLGAAIYRRVSELMHEPAPTPEPDTPPMPTIPARFIEKVHGKDFVLYAGLLHMAREAGLQRGCDRSAALICHLSVAL